MIEGLVEILLLDNLYPKKVVFYEKTCNSEWLKKLL